MDLSAFTKAGLKQTEIGTIVGVTNTTVGFWMRGQRDPHLFVSDRVESILAAVNRAVDKGDLPLSAQVPRAERLEKIQAVINEHT